MKNFHSYSSLPSRVVLVFVLLFTIKLAFPPFYIPLSSGVETAIGYDWIWAKIDTGYRFNEIKLFAKINISQLTLELFAIFIVGCVLYFWAEKFGASYFGRLSKLRRKLTRSECADVDEILEVAYLRKRELTDELLLKHNFTKHQIEYIKEYQIYCPFNHN